MSQDFLVRKIEALERKVELLQASIKETWKFIDYKSLPLSLELEIEKQPTLTDIDWNRKAFAPLLNVTQIEALRILQETNEPIHYKVIVEAVERNHADLLKRWSEPNIAGKVRDLASQGVLKRVARGMYFYGPKLMQGVNCEKP